MSIKHKLLSILTVLLSISSLSAAKYAVFFEKSMNNDMVVKFCNQNNYEMISFLTYEQCVLVSAETMPEVDGEVVKFVSNVKEVDRHVAFAKNELIVKGMELTPNFNLLNDYLFPLYIRHHPIIPDVTTIGLAKGNEDDLLLLKESIESQFPDALVDVNFVHTLSVATVNDPLYDRQWSIDNQGTGIQGNGIEGADMKVDSAWMLTTGNINMKVAILDSGVDTLHEDLVNNILPGFDGFASDTSDTKGYPTPNFSSDGHGTACAGIVAASGNNNVGIAGVAYDTKIVPIRIFYYQDYGMGIGVQATTNTAALLSGSAHAWREANVDIMSTSAGLSPLFIGVLGISTDIIDAEIEEAYHNGRTGRGVPMFFSAGNDDVDDVLWPADLPVTIAVGASSMCDERKNPNDCSSENWGSSYGEMLDVVAPGTLIAATDMSGSNGYTGGNYTYTFNGTSAACPNAAGVGALILAMNSTLHARDVKHILNVTADRVGAYDYNSNTIYGTWDLEMGHGRVNAYEAVTLSETFSSTVTIESLNKEEDWMVYPVPSSGIVNFENSEDTELHLKVYNQLGELVYDFTLEKFGKHQLDVPAGYYFVTTGSKVKKLLVTK